MNNSGLSLRWNNVDLDNREISIVQTATIGLENQLIVQTPKTSSSNRKIPIDNETASILMDWKAAQSEILLHLGHNPNKTQLVFPNTKNSVMAPSKVGQIMNRIIERCDGLKRITVHGLRHTCCSLMFASGATLIQVQAVLGHTDAKTTLNVYTHVAKKEQEKTTQAMADYLAI